MTIKKQFVELNALLELNKNKKVSTILPQLIEIMSRKNNSSGQANTFHKTEDGEIVAIYCYYHKQWELVNKAEYGAKANTATGLNTMCKEGVSNWTKQQRTKKKAEVAMLTQLSSGELLPEEIVDAQYDIAEEAKLILPRGDGHGHDELEGILCQDVADEVNTETED